MVHFGTDKAALAAFTGTSAAVDDSLTGGVKYVWNHVTVIGIEKNTKYYYTVEKNGVETEPAEYATKSFSEVKLLYVVDPQIGASKGQPQNGEKLTETAGDQVNNTGRPKEEEYAGYLSPELLKSLPVATTIGNHDSLNPDYMYHFDNPNASEYGKTEADGDYWYSYGEGLFIVLNTNNYNVAEHEKAIAEAVESDPDAVWRIVTIHQDIYGTGLDHSDTDGMILRTQLTPIFDKYDIDVVLQGHDHTYSRSKLLYGDGQTHSGYEFQLNADGFDYDWDHAYNVTEGEQISLNSSDAEGSALISAFQTDNLCYTIESVSGNTVVSPRGTLYMSANSASGSKFYELISPQQDYIAVRSQNWLPSYSVITMTGTSFAIDTYQITDRGDVEPIDATFTIVKDASKPANTPAALARAATLECKLLPPERRCMERQRHRRTIQCHLDS